MSTYAPKREQLICPAGTYQAICYGVWDVGMQEIEYKGEKKILPKLYIAWELDLPIEEGKLKGERYRITKRYTFSFEKKATLKADVESWIGRPIIGKEKYEFDVDQLIGQNCFLNIIHNESNGNTYANIKSVIQLPKGQTKIVTKLNSNSPQWVQDLRKKAIDMGEEQTEIDESEAIIKEEEVSS